MDGNENSPGPSPAIPDVDDLVDGGDDDLAPGAAVGEYVIDRKIGEGGFGSVYRAVQPVIDKEVAIKVLKRQFSSNRDIVSRFVSEARAVNKIKHRHIIDVFSFGKLPDGRQYYVMNFLRGESFRDRLRRMPAGRMTPAEARPILRAVAEALDAAHAAGVAHRDLKPENVFVCDSGDVKLLDFGIAKLMSGTTEHRTETGAPMGTPHYMSPEQAHGKAVDHRTDIYAFGVMAYQVLTGRLPFTGESMMAIALKHVSEEPPPPSTHDEDLDVFDACLLAMLAKEPDDRPQTLGEAMRAIEAAAGLDAPAGGERTPSRRTPLPKAELGTAPTLAGDTAQPRRRRSLKPVLLGLAVLVAGVVVLGLVVRSDDDGEVPALEPQAAPPAAAAEETATAPAEDPPPAAPTPSLPPAGGGSEAKPARSSVGRPRRTAGPGTPGERPQEATPVVPAPPKPPTAPARGSRNTDL